MSENQINLSSAPVGFEQLLDSLQEAISSNIPSADRESPYMAENAVQESHRVSGDFSLARSSLDMVLRPRGTGDAARGTIPVGSLGGRTDFRARDALAAGDQVAQGQMAQATARRNRPGRRENGVTRMAQVPPSIRRNTRNQNRAAPQPGLNSHDILGHSPRAARQATQTYLGAQPDMTTLSFDAWLEQTFPLEGV